MKRILFLISIVICLTSCGISIRTDSPDYKYKWEVEVTYLKDDVVETLNLEMDSNLGQECSLKLTETGCLKGTCLIDEKIFVSTGVKKFNIISEDKQLIEKPK